MPVDNSMDYESQVAMFPEPGTGGNYGTSAKESPRAEGGKLMSSDDWIKWSDAKQAETERVKLGQLHSSVAPHEADLATGFREQLKNIYKMEDPIDRNTAYYQLLGSRDAMVAKAKVDAFSQAEAEYNVPELQKMYKDALALDKADPLWSKYQTASTATNKIQDQLMQAANAAKGQAEKYYLGNSAIQSITKSLDPELKAFEQITNRLEKVEAKKLEEKQSLMIFGDEARQLAKWATPGMAPSMTDATAVAYMKHPQFQQVVFTTDPKELMPMALSGNKFAEIALVEKQAIAAAGTDHGNKYEAAKAKAAGQYSVLRDFATNPAIRENVLESMPEYQTRPDGKPSPLMAKFKASLNEDDHSKEASNMRTARWVALGNDILSKQNRANFEGNVSDWNNSSAFKDPNTPLGQLYAKAQEKLGTTTISVQNLAGQIKQLDPSLRANAQLELTKVAREASKQFSGTYYGNFTDSLNTELMVQNYVAVGISPVTASLVNMTNKAAQGLSYGLATGVALGAVTPVTAVVGGLAGAGIGAAVGAARELPEVLRDIFSSKE